MKSMRIAFCGNIGNTLYQIAKSIRTDGIDAHLFVERDDPLSYRPESDDAELAEGYPSWIHEGRWMHRHHGIVPFRSPLVAELNQFDLVIASGTYPIVAHLAKPPLVFLTTGADLTLTPFAWRSRHRHSRRIDQLGYAAVAFWQRRAIRSADTIWTQPFDPFQRPLAELKVDPSRIQRTALTLAIDTDVFRPVDAHPATVEADIAHLQSTADFIVVHPTRLVFNDDDQMMRTGQTKGSDQTVTAFARFVEMKLASNPRLVLPRRGPDVEIAERLIGDLGIGEFIHWAQPPRPGGFTRAELISYYSIATVVVDQFSAGWFGNISLEGMSCGVPVIARLDEDRIREMYGSDYHWLAAQNAVEGAAQLAKVANDRTWARELGDRSREWVQRHHSLDASRRKYVQLCQQELGQQELGQQELGRHRS